MVKMPLIRIAHPSDVDCQKEYKRQMELLKKTQPDEVFGNQSKSNDLSSAAKIDEGVILTNGPQKDALYDPTLTPRARWEKQVCNLTSLLEQEKEKYRGFEISKMEEVQQLQA